MNLHDDFLYIVIISFLSNYSASLLRHITYWKHASLCIHIHTYFGDDAVAKVNSHFKLYQLDWYRWANSDQSSNIIMKCAYKAVKLKKHRNIFFNLISILMQSWAFSQKASENAIISPPICKIIYVALLDGIITKVFFTKSLRQSVLQNV